MKNKIKKFGSIFLILVTTIVGKQALAKDQKSIQNQINSLQKQINSLQKQIELSQEKIKNSQSANVELGNKGLIITSQDENYSFKIKGLAQIDSRNFITEQSNQSDQFLVRSARIILENEFTKDFSSKFVADFGSGQTRLVDAYGEWKANEHINLRIGKFKIPVGFERWQDEGDLLFVERGLTTNLVPSRDIGIGLNGEIIPQTLEYQFALTNGAVDLGDSNGDSGNGKNFSGRIFAQPFKNSKSYWFKGLGIGISGSIGNKNGTSTNSELTSGYRTTAQNSFFTYNSGVFAKGRSTRINPQFWYHLNSLEVMAEYIESENNVEKSGVDRTKVKNKAWMLAASYVLTGEEASFKGVKPKNNFDSQKGHYGAFEIAARIGQLTIDDSAFSNFANINNSANRINEKVIGLNWYLNENMKLNFNYANNSFSKGANGSNRKTEQSFLSRLQIKF